MPVVFPDSHQELKLVRAIGNAARALVTHAAIGLRSEGMALTIIRDDDSEVCCEMTVRWFERLSQQPQGGPDQQRPQHGPGDKPPEHAAAQAMRQSDHS
jgi:hypothetical protein